MNTTCPVCQLPGKLKSGPWGLYYHCESHDTMVGCHRGTITPKGRMAGPETRALRIAAHDAFDPIWKREYMSRKQAYAWLGGMLGLKKDDCHIALMSDAHLRKAAALCATKQKQLMEARTGVKA